MFFSTVQCNQVAADLSLVLPWVFQSDPVQGWLFHWLKIVSDVRLNLWAALLVILA